MLRFDIHQFDIEIDKQRQEPLWSPQLEQWYQLDDYAFALCELFYKVKPQFEYLLLASPQASNATDFDFAVNGACRAQKFVHTLPNIRASMAISLLDQHVSFCCIDGGSETLWQAFEEFEQKWKEKKNLALASCFRFTNADNNPIVRALLFLTSPQGKWKFTETGLARFSDIDFIQSVNTETPFNFKKFNLMETSP